MGAVCAMPPSLSPSVPRGRRLTLVTSVSEFRGKPLGLRPRGRAGSPTLVLASDSPPNCFWHPVMAACKSRPAPQACALRTLWSRRRQRRTWRSRSAVIVSRHTAPLPRQWRAATPVSHHQQQAWGGWPAARLTVPRVASVHRRAHRANVVNKIRDWKKF